MFILILSHLAVSSMIECPVDRSDTGAEFFKFDPHHVDHIPIDHTVDHTFTNDSLFPVIKSNRGMIPLEPDYWRSLRLHTIIGTMSAVHMGDIDRDGKPDLLFTSTLDGNGTITWCDPDELFHDAGSVTSTIIGNAESDTFILKDIDHDHDLDIVVADHSNGTLGWFESPSDPSKELWEWHLIGSGLGDSVSLDVGDINDDGRFDVVLSSTGGNQTLWFSPDANYSKWDEHLIDGSLSLPSESMITDMDLDGDLDVITVTEVGFLGWYENTGSDAWNTHVVSDTSGPLDGLSCGDIDSDGKPDIVCSDTRNAELFWYNSPSDPRNDWQFNGIQGSFPSVRSTIIADLDEDGWDDIVVSSSETGVTWIRNSNVGFIALDIGSSDGESEGMALHDADEDGDLDIITAVSGFEGTSELTAFLNPGHGYSGRDVVFHPYLLLNESSSFSFAAGQVDPDPSGEIIVGAGNDLRIVHIGKSPGEWESTIISENRSDPAGPLIEDIDRDGDNDVLVADEGRLLLYRNMDRFAGVWEEILLHDTLEDIIVFQTGHFNGDHLIDIAVLNSSSLFILLQSVPEGWMVKKISTKVSLGMDTVEPIPDGHSLPSPPPPLQVRDVDRDLRDDIIVLSDGNLSWFRNDGNEEDEVDEGNSTFTERVIYTGGWMNAFIAVDLAGNDVIDIFYAANDSSDHGILMNPQDEGAWLETGVPIVANMSLPMITGDIDDDGFADVLILSPNGSELGVLYFEGWTGGRDQATPDISQSSIKLMEDVSALSLMDIDSDGDIDILARTAWGELKQYMNEFLLIDWINFPERTFGIVNPGGALSLDGYRIHLGSATISFVDNNTSPNNITFPDTIMPANAALTIKEGDDPPLDFQNMVSRGYGVPFPEFPGVLKGSIGISFDPTGSLETSESDPRSIMVDFVAWIEVGNSDQQVFPVYNMAVNRGIWVEGNDALTQGNESVILRNPPGIDTNDPSDFIATLIPDAATISIASIELFVENVSVVNPTSGDRIEIAIEIRNDHTSNFVGQLTTYWEEINDRNNMLTIDVYVDAGSTGMFHIFWSPSPEHGNHTLLFRLEDYLGNPMQGTEHSSSFTVHKDPDSRGVSSSSYTLPLPDSSEGAMIIVVTISVVTAAVALYTTERLKYRVLGFIIPLYTRIAKKDIEHDIMEQNYRGRIYQFIKDHPGTNYTLIKKTIGIGNGQVTHHLDMLKKHGFIKERNSGKSKVFCISGINFPEQSVLPIRLNHTQEKIIHIVKDSSPIIQKEVLSRLGYSISQQAVSSNIKVLEAYDLVQSEKKGIRRFLSLHKAVRFIEQGLLSPDQEGHEREFFFSQRDENGNDLTRAQPPLP